MEQAIPQPKQSSMGRNIFLATGIILLVGLVAVMAVNMQKIESVDLQSKKAPEFSLTLFDQFEQNQITLTELRG